ncbi:sterol desaturase family protein [Jannaschia donghaensis]|uniref:Fatty acid hydroxylase superfamily protein n=1 Tax=Jannaschia donghaensis TaxID=420998 RepID=A0A0M6YHX0_9RHOB|nr:sterol desaturase family protein [Jannaschia donghaensis]CTQ49514.1 Fatty acid hydroxylase superfamily protein [Jannaschia donghaensis]
MQYIQDLFVQSAQNGMEAIAKLIWPALAFLAIGMLTKGRQLFTDMRRAVPETSLNIKLMMFNLLFVAPGLVLFSQWSHNLVVGNGYAIFVPMDWSVLDPLVIMLVAIFIGDFTGYWRHRLEHTPILWPSHAVHHSDEEMTWLTLQRFHPVNRLTTFAIDSSVLLLLGFPAFAIIANSLVRHYYGYLIHADLPWTYGRASHVFVSPAMHRWHHSLDERFFQTNFATVFSIFDRAFGTYRVPGPCTSPLGVTDDIDRTLRAQLGYMFTPRAYRKITSGAASIFSWKTAPKEDAPEAITGQGDPT